MHLHFFKVNISDLFTACKTRGEGARGGGGTPLYTVYGYVPPDRVGFLRCSVLK